MPGENPNYTATPVQTYEGTNYIVNYTVNGQLYQFTVSGSQYQQGMSLQQLQANGTQPYYCPPAILRNTQMGNAMASPAKAPVTPQRAPTKPAVSYTPSVSGVYDMQPPYTKTFDFGKAVTTSANVPASLWNSSVPVKAPAPVNQALQNTQARPALTNYIKAGSGTRI